MMKPAIGGKGLNSGIRGGLCERKHFDAMGGAVFLFGWLVHRQFFQLHHDGYHNPRADRELARRP